MVRIKMPLKLIEGEKHRNTIFMKRRVVIKKKTMELGKLCDIVTLVVCFGPRGQLETWPEDPQEVRRLLVKYGSLRPDECIKRSYDLSTFFEAHLKKLQKELARERSSWLDSAAVEYLEELAQSLDAKLAAVEQRIAHLRLEEEHRGKEIELWGQHQQNQLFHHLLLEDLPPLPPFDAIPDAHPIQGFEGLDFSTVKLENFRGLQSHAAAAVDAVWQASHDLLRSEMPCTLAHPAPDPYMLPVIPDHGFSLDMSYVDDFIMSSPFLTMDFAPYSTPAGASTSSSVPEALNMTRTAYPLSFCSDAPLGYSGGSSSTGIVPSSSSPQLPPFDQTAFDARYRFALHRLPTSNPAVMCNQVYHQNKLCGDEFVQQESTAGPSLGEAWSTSIFLDLPQTAGCSRSNSAQAVAPGRRESSKLVPTTSATINPYI